METWASFPAEHKKRFYQGVGGYAILCVLVVSWISLKAKDTLEDWQNRIPSATVDIKEIYLTPQITDVTPPKIDVPDNEAPVISDGRAYVAIIMSDLGLSAAPTERALHGLPPEITLAFSPYADNLKDWLAKASGAKHESLVLMPMESSAYPKDDPGSRALSSRLSDKDNEDNLNWILGQSQGAAGFINLMGSRFLTDKKRLAPVFQSLLRNSSMFIEAPGTVKSEAPGLADQTGLPYLAVDAQIDSTASEGEILRKLTALEKTARERGYAIGIVTTYPLTFNTLKSWISNLNSRGITLVPLTSVWKNKPRHEKPAPEQPKQP